MPVKLMAYGLIGFKPLNLRSIIFLEDRNNGIQYLFFKGPVLILFTIK